MKYEDYIKFLEEVSALAKVKPRPRPPMKTPNLKL